jgi:aryl-alcohol dehydrogenase-like predicted oxidoreductase
MRPWPGWAPITWSCTTQHRVPDSISVEDVAAVMGELIAEGKILGWGQSQATEEQIRRAHAVTPLTAIQSEYSIMERMFEKDVIPACEELGIGFVPFSPLASGFLSGKVTANDTYTGDDVRRVITRFDKDNIRANQPLLDLLTAFAKEKGATPAQISLAWMLHKKDFISLGRCICRETFYSCRTSRCSPLRHLRWRCCSALPLAGR